MKRNGWICVLLAVLMAFGLSGCAGTGKQAAETIRLAAETEKTTAETEKTTAEMEKTAAEMEKTAAEKKPENEGSAASRYDEIHHAEITVRDYGTIRLELDGTKAPITVANFIRLARSGFYDGLTFHRIIDGFMIQGGDPLGNGTGGSEEKIKGEFSDNGVPNNISHVKGVISMTRASDYNSASSQFFITVADATFLDKQYAAFGHVTEGMEIVEKIAKDAKPTDNNGSIKKEEQPVISSIVITD